jgi:hypothetical protein
MASNRIYLSGPYIHEEAIAASAGIYPGMLLKLNSSGEVALHTTSGGVMGDEVLIAEEDALQGKNKDTVYADDAIVSYIVCQPGTVVNMLIADAEDIAIGDKIVSNGDGLLAEAGGLASAEAYGKIVGVAIEANDLSGSAVANGHSAVRVS